MALGKLFVLPRTTPLDAGNPIASSRLYFYRTGTTTAQNTYSDSTLSSSNANPVVADSDGEFGKIYLDPTTGFDYRVRWTTSADVQIWQEDDVVPDVRAVATYSSGSFTGTLTGYASPPTGTVAYQVIANNQGTGKFASLYVAAAITGTSNANTFTMTGLPAAVRPTAATYAQMCVVTDNTISVVALASISSAGTITFGMGAGFSSTGFTTSGTKALPTGWSLIYPL
jgi:hypothetical protein